MSLELNDNPEALCLPYGASVFNIYKSQPDYMFYGIHGTSVDAIAYLVRFGTLPTDGELENRFYYLKNLFNCPLSYGKINSSEFNVRNRLNINRYKDYYSFDIMIGLS